MKSLIISATVGVMSGIATYAASLHALGYTNAFVMPQGFPIPAWEMLVVFGLGAGLVAFLIHLVALCLPSIKPFPAFAGFLVAAIASLVVTGQLGIGYKALLAWLIGAVLASAIGVWLRPNNSFKPTPLRGAA